MLLIANAAAGGSARASIEAAAKILRASGEVAVETTDDAADLTKWRFPAVTVPLPGINAGASADIDSIDASARTH